MNGNFGYFVSVTEYERGWGSKPDGYVVFNSEKEADYFLKQEYASRGNQVPDYYLDYSKSGYRPISQGLANAISNNGKAYVD
jgi:hypothetical protein